jgi:hypothetical protein
MFARLLNLALLAALAAYLAYFAAHAWLMLGHQDPLDYGEGPLLAQVELLRAGTPIWQLYADPAQPPYAIVNYPPLYLLLAAALSYPLGSPLLAGRLLSLLATCGIVAALWQLAPRGRGWLALFFLTIPVVREWSVLMRVDLLGICFGLWGIVFLRGARNAQFLVLGALFLLACLFSKPSLIAAPGAACLWLAWRAFRAAPNQRREAWFAAMSLYALLATGGGLLLLLLQQASGGWFLLHVVTANANRWEPELATGFWFQQFVLRWPLFLGSLLSVWGLLNDKGARDSENLPISLLYTALATITAIGVGKVGAYSNYFLELYVGLLWLIAQLPNRPIPNFQPRNRVISNLLLLLSLAYYPPLWDTERLRPAGLVEPSPPRFAFGSYNLLDDQRREAAVLAALARVNTALRTEVRAAGPVLFSDMPGLAAQAGVISRLQVFEQRQLYDQQLATQIDLLHELANGELPLATIDYLGNWLTPEVVELLERRYAQDGSLGTTDLFRPIEAGPFTPFEQALATSTAPLLLRGYQLGPPAGTAYEPGELIVLNLWWERQLSAESPRHIPPEVTIMLHNSGGASVISQSLTLLYGAFPPEQWQTGRPVQHLQPLQLPANLPAGRYQLSVALRDGATTSASVDFVAIDIASGEGELFSATGQFVPGLFRQAWHAEGGLERLGLPLTPVVPFTWGRLQCYERGCLEQRSTGIVQRPLGDQLYLAETLRSDTCIEGMAGALAPCDAALAARERFGVSSLGPPISGEISRNGYFVQWTRYARIERNPTTGEIGFGRLGDDVQRLAPGMKYRWP